MNAKELLQESSKAQLQSLFLHWFPGKEMVSARDRLVAELEEVMVDPVRVRERFDALPRQQQAFVVSLLGSADFSGTVADVRGGKHGRLIQDFEVEGILKTLQDAGYIAKTGGAGGYDSEIFSVPHDLAAALRRTVSVEERQPMQMLSLAAAQNGANGELASADEARRRIRSLGDAKLRKLVEVALRDHFGVLTHGTVPEETLDRPEWRQQLEEKGLGTTGVLSLRDFGIDLEAEGLILYQENVRRILLGDARKAPPAHEREICMGADLIIDLDRALELLRTETLEVTREGNIYRKIEERIAGNFVTTSRPELNDNSAVGHILELCRKLGFFDDEGQRIVLDPLRRRVWRKRPLLSKVQKIFEIYSHENRGLRWSFHQNSIRRIFLDQLRTIAPGEWVQARPFLSAALSKYLLSLEEAAVAAEYQERCAGDFRHETLVVPLQKLYHDLSYWVLHRLALLGLVDVAYEDSVFTSLRLSTLGARLFEFMEGNGQDAESTEDVSRLSAFPVPTNGDQAPEEARILVNPDFEILVYPEVPEETSWTVSFFADRVDSDRVKRYRITKESIQRGVVAGLTHEEILKFLETHVKGSLPPNIVFSLREWGAGVQLVRKQKVTLLRSASGEGARRVAEILERNDVPFERLNDTSIVVRGAKNDRALDELQQHFRDSGLVVE